MNPPAGHSPQLAAESFYILLRIAGALADFCLTGRFERGKMPRILA
jgi:hypothetical protein